MSGRTFVRYWMPALICLLGILAMIFGPEESRAEGGGAIFAAVHHAEVIAARFGEPFGSIILAVAVTVIEVGLIVALMLASPDGGLIGCMGKMGSTIIAHPRFTAGLDHTTPFIDLSQGVNVTPRCIVSSPNWI